MKKLFSISIAFFILVSGMHLSIATHTCGGELAAVKLSFSAEKATCGMEDIQQTYPAHKTIASDCCHNNIAFFTVDNDYSPSSFQMKEATNNLLQVFSVPVIFTLQSFTPPLSISTFVQPMGNLLANAVSLSSICIFRI